MGTWNKSWGEYRQIGTHTHTHIVSVFAFPCLHRLQWRRACSQHTDPLASRGGGGGGGGGGEMQQSLTRWAARWRGVCNTRCTESGSVCNPRSVTTINFPRLPLLLPLPLPLPQRSTYTLCIYFTMTQELVYYTCFFK